MKHGRESVRGLPGILRIGLASLLLFVLLSPTFAWHYVVAEDESITLHTDRNVYNVSQTVIFSGSGYGPSGTSYELNITYEGYVVKSIEFKSEDSSIPGGVSWRIPLSAYNGSYLAEAFSVTEQDHALLASTTFKVLSNITIGLGALRGELMGLSELVMSGVHAQGINNSLLMSLNNTERKIETALSLLSKGENKTAANQLRASRNMLTAFVHKVSAQAGKGIDSDLALALIDNASSFINYMDSMIDQTMIPLGKQLALNVEETLAKQERNLNRFVIKKGLAEAETDEEKLALLNSTEADIETTLTNLSNRNRLMNGRWANGTTDYLTLVMELQRENETAESVRDVAKLLLDEMTSLNQTRPSLGKHLGQTMKATRMALENSMDAAKGIGQMMSAAHSKAQQEKQQGNGHNGDGKGNHGKSNENNKG